MSAKIHFLKRDNKFYNSKDETWYSNILNANYDRDFNKMKLVVKLFPNSEIHTVTEEDFMQELAMITTNAVLAGSYFAEILKKINYTIPTISRCNKLVYQKCKNAIDALEPFSKFNKEFVNRKEDETDEVSGHLQEYLSLLSDVEVYKTAEVVEILKAYKKDRASILGIVKKINR